jgi:hypothetical protein
MKRLSTFLVFAFLGVTVAKAQSDLLYISGENDNVPGDAPTLYVSGGEDLYIQGGVNIANANTRGDGLIQVAGTLHIGDFSGTGPGNWTNNTGAAVYTYSKTNVPANSYTPGNPISYGSTANTVSLEYGNQLILGGTTISPSSVDTSYFYNLSLLDLPSANNVKEVVGADIYIGAINSSSADTLGMLDLNAEYLNTPLQTVHILNPDTNTTGPLAAISRLDGGVLANRPSAFSDNILGGMVIASNVGQAEYNARLTRVVNRSGATYVFPVGSLVTVPAGFGSGQGYNLFRPAAITGVGDAYNVFGVALVPDDGFVDAGTALDQAVTPWHNLAGINHQSYFKINQIAGPATQTNAQQITLYHAFYNNSVANALPNWSTCGNLPTIDFPQTLTIAQWDNNPPAYGVSWNDVCHGNNAYNEMDPTLCGSVVITPNNDFCSTTVTRTAPQLEATSTVAYSIPGQYYNNSGNNPQEDYTVAGLFFTVDEGTGTCDGNCAALPLNIISLTGWNVPNQNENELQWVTATEENTDNFVVEKSTDGENFTVIGQQEAAHFSSAQKTYTLYDNQPNMGNNYYRVRENFNVGPSNLTNVINVPLDKKITIANIYPNPTTGNLNVAFETSEAGMVHLEVYDVLGRLVVSGDNAVNEGNNTIIVNTSVLTAGSYFIRLIDAQSNFTDTQKFIKIIQ